jgi:sortase A
MKRYGMRRTGRTLAVLAGAVVVLIGLAVAVYPGFGGQVAPASTVGTVESGLVGAPRAPMVPENTEMRLTVPKMARVDDVPVYTAPASDEGTLDRGAMHLAQTGYPWQDGANVYIAGHRLGYKGTGSYLQFYDLDRLGEGDEIFLTDANGTRYTYTVFRKQVVDPSEVSVTWPVPGKSVVSLQTCTLPDYSQRLIVQGELTSVG